MILCYLVSFIGGRSGDEGASAPRRVSRQRYYDVFWEKWGRKRGLTFRAPEMEEFSGILARIEKGEAKLSRKDGVEQVRERGVIQG